MELQITALENGIVIDHIPPERTFAIVKMLKLKEHTDTVTVGFNLHSNVCNKKGLIKIADKTLTKSELAKISLLAPRATVNIIKDSKVVQKIPLELPDEIEEFMHCENFKCMSNNEAIPSRFMKVQSHGADCYKCFYCERVIPVAEIKLNLN
ncbi:MAG: aspartate carbamoyltransferase regulatory subunit [Treponema sp.]